MSQLAYTQDPALAFEGMIADLSDTDIMSVIATPAALAFGRGVCVVDTAAPSDTIIGAKLVDATGDVTGLGFLGFTVRDPTGEFLATGYPINKALPVLRKGRIWVSCQTAAVYGAAVFLRFDGGNEGIVRNDADTANAVAIPGARFRSSLSGAGLAIVELNP